MCKGWPCHEGFGRRGMLLIKRDSSKMGARFTLLPVAALIAAGAGAPAGSALAQVAQPAPPPPQRVIVRPPVAAPPLQQAPLPAPAAQQTPPPPPAPAPYVELPPPL